MPHPYTEFEFTAAWRVVDDALRELEANQDLAITTARPYVIGYVCRHLVEAGLALNVPDQLASEQTRGITSSQIADPAHVQYRVDQPLDDDSLNALFARAWPDHRHRHFGDTLTRSLGTVAAFVEDRLVGFVNLATDGGEHAFLLDPTVDPLYRRQGIGRHLVQRAAALARERDCRWLHVDYEPRLEPFYLRAGFRPSTAGVMLLDPTV